MGAGELRRGKAWENPMFGEGTSGGANAAIKILEPHRFWLDCHLIWRRSTLLNGRRAKSYCDGGLDWST